MTKTQGYKIMKDGVMLIHPDIQGDSKTTGDSIQIPQVGTALGAGFGDTITDKDRAFAVEREPIAHFLTYGVAADITEKWFILNDPDTEEADPALDRTIQDALTQLKFMKYLTEAVESERTYGKSYLVCGFNDAKNIASLKQPKANGSQLMQLAVYPSTKNGTKIKEVTVEQKDEDKNSPRYGEPVIYKLHRDSDYLFVHYTRVCEVQTRSNATSVLDPIWDDLNCGRNIRWGAAQWLYRTGGGFPVMSFPSSTTAEQLEAYHVSGTFSNLMSRTGIFIAQNSLTENTGMTFDFKGPSGAALDPTPFFKTNIEQISIATGIPQPKLVGAQAGAVTGSEVNVSDYYKVISREQAKLEEVVRWVIDRLAESGQITLVKSATDNAKDNYQVNLLKRMLHRFVRRDYRHKTAKTYVIEWNPASEPSQLDEANVEMIKARTNQSKLDYMTKDEVRALEGLDPLPNGEGAVMKQPFTPFQKPQPNDPNNPQQQQEPNQNANPKGN